MHGLTVTWKVLGKIKSNFLRSRIVTEIPIENPAIFSS